MKTTFKPQLESYGDRGDRYQASLKKVLGVIAALPLGTSWLFMIIPFVKGGVWVRL